MHWWPVILFSALLVGAPCANATNTASVAPGSSVAKVRGVSQKRLQRLDRYMETVTVAGGYTGAVTLVMRDGNLVQRRAYGFQDLARSVPMREDTIFRIYSMTKTVTSVAVLMLLEEGRLSLDDPIARHLPEFANTQVLPGEPGAAARAAAGPITIQHLLTHTAGFPAGRPGDDAAAQALAQINPHGAADLTEFSRRLGRTPLAADPGTRFAYDGPSSEVLARLVEVTSGRSFSEFLQQRIFDPLKMGDTGFSVPLAQRSRVVDITRMDSLGQLVIAQGPSAIEPGAPLNLYPSGAGGLYSTAADYARFAQMLLNGGNLDGASILGRKTVELMMENHLGKLDPPVTQFSPAEGFGLGGYVVLDVARRGQLGSTGQFGWAGAASTSYTVDPREGLVAIVLLQHLPNSHADDLPRISRHFYNLVYQALD